MSEARRFASLPAIIARHGRCSVLTVDGELVDAAPAEALELLGGDPPLLIHRAATARRLGVERLDGLDLLELFALVLPARTAAPTARGLRLALGMEDRSEDTDASTLPELAEELLRRAERTLDTPNGAELLAITALLAAGGWNWGMILQERLRRSRPGPTAAMPAAEALKPWLRLPKWAETAPKPPAGQRPVSEHEARSRLAAILGRDAEHRAGQADYAGVAAGAFEPRARRGDPHLVLAEAGTGTGKTLGYIAPASLWAERNAGSVWISTYTRHLQRQIEGEAERLYPDREAAKQRVVLRKGRENYLCLLNLEEELSAAAHGGHGVPVTLVLALIVRWVSATADGDVQGGDLPGWLPELFGAAVLGSVMDRRGECIHGACRHYARCFVERSIRRARNADLVIANHALVMTQAAWHSHWGASADEDALPSRYVFDEGHHVDTAADTAFSVELSGHEAAELRRWLLGAEGGRSRSKGLRRRFAEMIEGEHDLEQLLDAALLAARILPAPGWLDRLDRDGQDADLMPRLSGDAENPTEQLLTLLRRQVLARSERDGNGECDLHPVGPELMRAAERLQGALRRISEPLAMLADRLLERLEAEAERLEAEARERCETLARIIRRKALSRLEGWIALLQDAQQPQDQDMVPTYITIVRSHRAGPGGGARDVGIHRHWLDPTIPFAAVLAAQAHGLLVTSATLRDQPDGAGAEDGATAEWEAAERRVGAGHLPSPAIRAAVMSPFRYEQQSCCLVVTDVDHRDVRSLAGAYRTLFRASGGGALGLFTAISRLRDVYDRIAAPLEGDGIPLLAQHVDAMNNATLVDIFRVETDSCLLGTDAMRDGVDVPGAALRLVVFERVPWPRPDILHRQRRIYLSSGRPEQFDDRIARLRLRQAFGRLIRTATDRGVFVLLDRGTPTRLLSAFPDGVTVQRVGLLEAARRTAAFLDRNG